VCLCSTRWHNVSRASTFPGYLRNGGVKEYFILFRSRRIGFALTKKPPEILKQLSSTFVFICALMRLIFLFTCSWSANYNIWKNTESCCYSSARINQWGTFSLILFSQIRNHGISSTYGRIAWLPDLEYPTHHVCWIQAAGWNGHWRSNKCGFYPGMDLIISLLNSKGFEHVYRQPLSLLAAIYGFPGEQQADETPLTLTTNRTIAKNSSFHHFSFKWRGTHDN